MPNVTLTKPVIHNGENCPAGTVLRDLSQKEAERLVRLGTATMGAVVREDVRPVLNTIAGDGALDVDSMKRQDILAALRKAGVTVTGKEKTDKLKELLCQHLAEQDTADDALSPEEIAEIDGMDKDSLVSALEDADVEVGGEETVEELRAKLKEAWTAEAAEAE